MKPIVRKGQEWFKEHSDGVASPPTRLLVLADPVGGRVSVGTVTKDGRVIRAREILVSALSKTPSGYRLVKDTPAPVAEGVTHESVTPGPGLREDGHLYECGNGGDDPEDCSSACYTARRRVAAKFTPSAVSTPTQPAPLARVREALRDYTLNGGTADARMSARDALAALAPLERVFPDAMQSLHERKHYTSDGATWQQCARCAALLEGK